MATQAPSARRASTVTDCVAKPAKQVAASTSSASAQTGLAAKWAGAWQDEQGRTYAIASLPDFPQMTWVDYQTGAWRYLFERDDRLEAGAGMATPNPVAITVARDRRRRVAGASQWRRKAPTSDAPAVRRAAAGMEQRRRDAARHIDPAPGGRDRSRLSC